VALRGSIWGATAISISTRGWWWHGSMVGSYVVLLVTNSHLLRFCLTSQVVLDLRCMRVHLSPVRQETWLWSVVVCVRVDQRVDLVVKIADST
jgi:hypothetical protein